MTQAANNMTLDAYMAQVERTYDRDLYKTYVFCDLLYRLLPKTPHEKVDLNKQIQLINSRIEEGKTQQIVLERGNPTRTRTCCRTSSTR